MREALRALVGARAGTLVGARACALVGARACASLVALALIAAHAHAQDFASPARAGTGETPGAFLESALPGALGARSLEMIAIQWDPRGEMTTRALAACAITRGIEWGAGISSTGDGEIGWNSLALAIGRAARAHGAGVRVLARRDRAADASGARALGAEAGAGFWSRVGARGKIWASAPMAFAVGEPPPLDRGLETGVSLSGPAFSAWALWSAPAGAVDAAEHGLGLACESGALSLWAEARSRPLRAAIALRARRGDFTVTARVDEHPVLGETVRFSLGVGAPP